MTEHRITNPAELKRLVDTAELAPEFFTREDGTRMAVVNGDFLERVLAVYADAVSSTVGEEPGIYDLPINGG